MPVNPYTLLRVHKGGLPCSHHCYYTVAKSAHGTVTRSPAKAVSRASLAGTSASSTHEPTAILSHVTCFVARLMGSGSCDGASGTTVSHGGEARTVASSGTGFSSAHNNVMADTRSISSERGASHETSASASAMARLYVCAYLPSSVGHTMGCN
jgi:hypothetical protein